MSVDRSADAYVDIAIVGGGATGIELAAELYNSASALKHYGLEVFDESRLRVTLAEAGPRILPALPEKLAKAAGEELESLGVHVLENTAVVEVMAKAMRTKSGREIPFDISVWAAGVPVAPASCVTSTGWSRLAITGSLSAPRFRLRAISGFSRSEIAAS
jgi:NADH dehydrogenase